MAKMKRRSIFECIYGGHCLVSYVTIVYMIEMRWTKSSKTIWMRARMARAFNLHCEMAVCALNHKWFVFSSFKRLHFVVAAAVFFCCFTSNWYTHAYIIYAFRYQWTIRLHLRWQSKPNNTCSKPDKIANNVCYSWTYWFAECVWAPVRALHTQTIREQ